MESKNHFFPTEYFVVVSRSVSLPFHTALPLSPRFFRHAHQWRQQELDQLSLTGLDLHRRRHAGCQVYGLPVHIHRRITERHACGIKELVR